MTGILVQPLASRRRKPRARDWKSRGFVAYRFVNARTGQATAMAVLGAATVG